MIPYVYYVKNITTGLKYIGCRFGKNADPNKFWVNYFTSSSRVQLLREKYGNDDFVFSIRKTFNNAKECFDYETRLLKRVNAAKSTEFLNKHNNDNSNVGWTYERRSAVGKGNKGRICITNGDMNKRILPEAGVPIGWWVGSKTKGISTGKRSTEFCEKMRQIALDKPPVSEATRKKQSAWQKGTKKKPLTEAHKEKLRGKRGSYGPQKKYKCPQCGKNEMSSRHIKFCKE